ncbi:glycosyltransferase family 117 protein [Sunxiuqinia sp. sy24]|uniref:glycosyltransferase family 117 protein n=1 Tax=Sunxiuqinia sp. sy24 TaxID=3461495 RepID=UPI004045D0EE
MNYQRKKNALGWSVFAISLIVYGRTIEPTLSLWDCGEFLVSAYKLQVCHAPGAPLFLLLGRIFSLFSFGHVERVPLLINEVSALSSAGTVMLLFFISTWVMEKIAAKQPNAILLASAVGALSFAFTDSFWFSALEAEVYALSSLFMALVLWAATRWEREAGEPKANRWLVLIFFFTGLSIGVHLLNLLVLPSIALIIYFKKYKPSFKGTLAVLATSGLFIIFLMKIFIPGIFSLAGPFELLAVNKLGLPVNSGFYFYLLLLASVISAALAYSELRRKPRLNLALLCLLFLMLGYTSYFVPFVRSAANPPLDQGNPETTFELINYLNRESYGSRPILHGETYGSVPISYKERISYEFDGEKYYPVRLPPKVNYAKGTTSFFPRLHSSDKQHRQAYANWVNLKERKVTYTTSKGEQAQTSVPTLAENFSYFWRYQFGHMYVRYFMWNFVGRQNDIQSRGELEYGNWQSGIPFLDRQRLGDSEHLPHELKTNKANNRYFFLPLILGLVGLIFHYRREKQSFVELIVLFGIMSVGLVIYLNEIPITPRERDYVFVGSFFVFSFWIGMGTLALFNWLQSNYRATPTLIITSILTLAAGPALLLHQNYDDHNRSGRYSARDMARNYLMCCEPNAILFTHADNDTYPLWYCQEVEGIRQDVRVVVMPYLNAGSYIKQITRKIYDNEGLKLSVPVEKYTQGEVDYLPIIPKIKGEQDLQKVLNFITNDSSQTKVALYSGEQVNFIPVQNMYLTMSNQKIPVQPKKEYLMHNELAFWDILNSNNANRPICFTSLADVHQYGLQNYIRNDGLVYRLVPAYYAGESQLENGQVETDRLYAKLMERCNWENLKDESIYFDWYHRYLFASAQIRPSFYQLAKALANENRRTEALQILQEAEEILPFRNRELDYYSILMCELYFQLEEKEVGEKQLQKMATNLSEWINYYLQLTEQLNANMMQNLHRKLYYFQTLVSIAQSNQLALAPTLMENLNTYMVRLE